MPLVHLLASFPGFTLSFVSNLLKYLKENKCWKDSLIDILWIAHPLHSLLSAVWLSLHLVRIHHRVFARRNWFQINVRGGFSSCFHPRFLGQKITLPRYIFQRKLLQRKLKLVKLFVLDSRCPRDIPRNGTKFSCSGESFPLQASWHNGMTFSGLQPVVGPFER